MNLKNIILALLLFSSILYSSSEVDVDKYFSMSLEELMQVEVLGSTRSEKLLLTVPSSVSVFTNYDIKKLGITNLNELINYVPGFQSTRTGIDSNTYISTVRGYTSGMANSNILLLVDGQRMTNEYTGGAGSIFSMISMENVKQIEFIRGASSSIYGSNAFSAVINITTLSSSNEVQFQVSEDTFISSALVNSNYDDISVSAFVKITKDNGVKYSNLLTNLDSSNPNKTTSAEDEYKNIDLYFKSTYKNFSLYISHKKRDTDSFYIVRRLSSENERDVTNSYVRATYDFDIINSLHSQIALSYSQNIDKTFTISADSAFFSNPKLKASANTKTKTPSVEWFNKYELNSDNTIVFGAEYRRPETGIPTLTYSYDVVNLNFTPGEYNFPLLDYSGHVDIYGVYGQYESSITNNIHLTLGLRYDDYSDVGGSLNPRVALVYDFLNKSSVKFLYSRAFRAPSINELYLINSGSVGGNKDLEPETIDTYELILTKEYNKHYISLSGYINVIDNPIIEVDSGTQQGRENADGGSYVGVDLEYIGNFTTNIQARFAYSHIFSKPDFAFRSSDDIVSSILNYSNNKFNANISGYFHSSSKNSYSGVLEKVPSYLLVDTKISYNIKKNLNIFFRIKNLLDKDYVTPSTGTSLTINVPNRGRESFFGLDISF